LVKKKEKSKKNPKKGLNLRKKKENFRKKAKKPR
jgi:hypothetical protein